MFIVNKITTSKRSSCIVLTFVANILLSIADKFTGSSTSGYLASPHFPNLYSKPVTSRCNLRPSGDTGEVRLQIIYLQLQQTDSCTNVFHVKYGGQETTFCRAGSGRFQAPIIDLVYETDGDTSNNGIWLYYDGK